MEDKLKAKSINMSFVQKKLCKSRWLTIFLAGQGVIRESFPQNVEEKSQSLEKLYLTEGSAYV
jgi:hypothetical protein